MFRVLLAALTRVALLTTLTWLLILLAGLLVLAALLTATLTWLLILLTALAGLLVRLIALVLILVRH